jgi:hypothetical protein
MVPQGSQSLALGLAKTAALQLDEFVRAHPCFLGKAKWIQFPVEILTERSSSAA